MSKCYPYKLKDMTPQELWDELNYWNEEIQNATSWGSSLAAAAEFRRDIEIEILRRQNDKV